VREKAPVIERERECARARASSESKRQRDSEPAREMEGERGAGSEGVSERVSNTETMCVRAREKAQVRKGMCEQKCVRRKQREDGGEMIRRGLFSGSEEGGGASFWTCVVLKWVQFVKRVGHSSVEGVAECDGFNGMRPLQHTVTR